MSGHETIRVLEVGVDAHIPAEEEDKGLEGVASDGSQSRGPAEANEPADEAGPDNPDSSAEATVKPLPGIPLSPAPVVTTFSQAPSQPQTSQTLTSLAVQAAPQVLTQENLATVLTGVMVPAGAVTQPLLIPISIAGQVAGQQGLAVWTIPTATVAALPGLTATSPTGGIFKPPLASLQGNGNSPQDCTRPLTTLHYHSCTRACHVELRTCSSPRATALEFGSSVPGTQPQRRCTNSGL